MACQRESGVGRKLHRSSSMKSILALAALGLAFAVTAPAFAEHHTKADCDKKQGYEWDEDAKKCVKESPGG